MQRAITATEKNAFRTRPQRARWYLAVHRPASLFSSRILYTPDTHPASAVFIAAAFNEGDATKTKRNQTVWIGAIPGASDEGTVRLRAPVSTTASIIPIAESGSGLNRYYAGKFVTVMDDFRPFPIMAKYYTNASQWKMDYDIAYESHLENYGPIIRMGPPTAGFLDGGTLTETFIGGSTQYIDTTHSAATWTFPDSQTEARLGTEASPVTKTFTGASPDGSYFSLETTAADGTSSISRRLIYAFNDRTGPAQVEFTTISGGINSTYKGKLRVTSGGNTDDFPDGAEILIFEEASYAGNATTIGGNYPERNNIVFRGWIVQDTVLKNPFSGDVSFDVVGIDEYLNKTHSKDIFLAYANPPTGASKWIEAQDLSIDRAAVAWGKHRSTVMEITDFVLASGFPMTAKIAFQDLPKSSLWKQISSNYDDRGTAGYVSADMQGNIYATEDVLISGLSNNLPLMYHIEAQDMRDTVTISHPHVAKNALVELYSVASTNYIGARSPGADAHGYFGGTKVHQRGLVAGEDAVAGQQLLTTWSGNLRAKLNNPYPKVTIPLAGNIKLDPVPQARITMSMSATDNVRGLNWNDKQFLPYKISMDYNSTTGLPLATIEMESVVDGKGGSAITFERIVPMRPQPPPIQEVPTFTGGTVVVFSNKVGTRKYS